MLWLKECPKCQGDLILDRDHYGTFKTCIQCGFLRDVVETAVGAGPAATSSKEIMIDRLTAMPIAA